jgi:hypothetical protein
MHAGWKSEMAVADLEAHGRRVYAGWKSEAVVRDLEGYRPRERSGSGESEDLAGAGGTLHAG